MFLLHGSNPSTLLATQNSPIISVSGWWTDWSFDPVISIRVTASPKYFAEQKVKYFTSRRLPKILVLLKNMN